jgi:signal transduction histidine kinase
VSFRLKLFVAIAVAVMLTALVEGTLDYGYDVWHDHLATRTRSDLRVFADAAMAALDLNGAVVGLDSAALERLPRLRGERLRIVHDGTTVLTFGGLFPSSPEGWATTQRFLVPGFVLDVALPLGLAERVLGSDLLLDLLDLPLLFALAFGVAWALTRIVMRPVGELTRALKQVSEQRFPAPVPVPDGDDELSELARSFNAMSASLQGLIERERAFTRYASHELRTPLSALKVHTEALELGLATAEATVPVLERNVQRMEGVLVALLALTRPADVDAVPATLEEVVQEVVSALPAAERERLTYVNRTQAPSRVANALLVRQATANLVENALNYSAGRVTVIVEATSREALLRVCDEGPGIPPDRLDEVRKPFVRGDHPTSGLGLGLALAENAVDSLRGRIDYVQHDDGFEVTVTLPLLGSQHHTVSDASAG